jgi:DNA-binding GntR family transcriptional regulator
MNSQEIINDLKKSIARGMFNPGQRLVEAYLCGKYGVGRGKIREVLRQLAHDGFVKITHNAGATVTELSQNDVQQILDILGAMEGLSMRVATPFISNEEIKKIEYHNRKMYKAKTPFEFFDHNLKFHSYMCSLSGNVHITKFTENLTVQAHVSSLRGLYHVGQIREMNREHQKIIEAIKQRNPIKVEKLIREHYFRTKNKLIKYLNRTL